MAQARTSKAYFAVPAIGLSLMLAGCSSSSSSGDATPAASATQAKSAAPTEAAPVKAPAPPSGSKELDSSSSGGATYARYSTSESPAAVETHYVSALKADGYTITNSGGGGGGWGKWGGGGAGVTADKSGAWIDVQAGGESGSTTYFEVCTGPSESALEHCDNQSNNAQDSNSKGS